MTRTTRSIGLTGDVGSGKSSLSRWLRDRGAATLDADRVAHAVLERPEVAAAVADRFGVDLMGAGGRIDRAALAAIVFADAAALRELEAILHPRVLAEAAAWLSEVEAPWAVIEAVKLVETGMHRHLDQVWLVSCAAELRRERLRARDWSEGEIARRMAAATPYAPRLAVADTVIDNSGSWARTERQLEAALRRMARAGRPLAPGRVIL